MKFLLNALLCCALIYGIVAAIDAKDILWAIAYSATLLKQCLYLISLHSTNI